MLPMSIPREPNKNCQIFLLQLFESLLPELESGMMLGLTQNAALMFLYSHARLLIDFLFFLNERKCEKLSRH